MKAWSLLAKLQFGHHDFEKALESLKKDKGNSNTKLIPLFQRLQFQLSPYLPLPRFISVVYSYSLGTVMYVQLKIRFELSNT